MSVGVTLTAAPATPAGSYQYCSSTTAFAAGELRRVSATVTDLGATPITGAFGLAVGTTGERPSSPITGYARYNTTTALLELWNGATWTSAFASASAAGSSGDYQCNNAGAFGGATLKQVSASVARFGSAASAAPTAQTLQIGEDSRSGTDNNVGGSSATIRSGLGTGTGAASSIAFQTPTLAGAGSGAQSYATRMTISTTAITAAGGAVWTGDGSGLTTLNASNLSSGTVPAARLAGKTYIGRTIISAVGSGNFTTAAATTTIVVQVWAGGGGGGGAAAAANAGCGGGGGAGGYVAKTFSVTGSTSYAYVVGAKGTGGAAGNNSGNNGSDSTFTVGGTTITAKGGTGGGSMASGGTFAYATGGDGGAVSTNGDINGSGDPGCPGQRSNVMTALGGQGGSTAVGGGGASRAASNGSGNAASGFGSGGGGACGIFSGGDQAGGNGADGLIIVDEYA